MGTRGWKIVRFRGRLYVYYNHLDSYPEHFGQDLVDRIPSDPGEYKEWLQKMRQFYARLERELEEHVLTIHDSDINDFVDLLELDVIRVPCGVRSKVDWDIEWTYTLDLDHEIFSVWDSAHFKMDAIPRDVWIKALSYGGRTQLTLTPDLCPPDSIAAPALVSQRHSSNDLNTYGHRYQKLDCSIVRASTRLCPDVQRDFQGRCFRGLVYMMFCDTYAQDFKAYSLTWVPDDLIFREMAFAVLSLASGQFRFETFQPGGQKLGLSWDPDRLKNLAHVTVDKGRGIDGSTVLPKFATGAHRPGEAPGSAPLETTYWFEDVLVCLATGLDKREQCQAAVVKAVETGLTQDATDFQAVIVDLLFCVLLDVHLEGGKPVVRHTQPISLFPIQPSDHLSTDPAKGPPKKGHVHIPGNYESSDAEGTNNDDREHEEANAVETENPPQDERTGNAASEESDQGDTGDFAPILSQPLASSSCSSAEEFSSYCPGFTALMEFFNVAVARRFECHPTTSGVFPPEIYTNILEYADTQTHRACSGISWAFRAHILRHFRIDDTYMLNDVQYSSESDPLVSVVNTVSSFCQKLAISRRADKTFNSSEVNSLSWVPVVGSERPSILSQVKVRRRLVL